MAQALSMNRISTTPSTVGLSRPSRSTIRPSGASIFGPSVSMNRAKAPPPAMAVTATMADPASFARFALGSRSSEM